MTDQAEGVGSGSGHPPDVPARHILDIDDLSAAELDTVLALAGRPADSLPPVLTGRGVAMVFEKASARTRSSTELAVVALGGHPVYIQGDEVGIDTRESAEDVALTLACYHSVLCLRVHDHQTLSRMAAALDRAAKPVPVLNLLSDVSHPCQAVADLLTLRQVIGPMAGRAIAYVGDANNVARSLAKAVVMVGGEFRIASPDGYGLTETDLAALVALGGEPVVTNSPADAVDGADAVYTDVWTSMGQEDDAAIRREAFAGFTLDEELLARAAPHAVVLHCLPAHRGEEISAGVVDGPQSVVWRQAANRLHAVRGLLAWLWGVPTNGDPLLDAVSSSAVSPDDRKRSR